MCQLVRFPEEDRLFDSVYADINPPRYRITISKDDAYLPAFPVNLAFLTRRRTRSSSSSKLTNSTVPNESNAVTPHPLNVEPWSRVRDGEFRWWGDSLHLGCVCEWKEFVWGAGMSFITVIRVDECWFDPSSSSFSSQSSNRIVWSSATSSLFHPTCSRTTSQTIYESLPHTQVPTVFLERSRSCRPKYDTSI